MSDHATTDPAAPPRAAHGWPQALLAVVAGLVAMIVVAALGLWAAGAADLPDGAYVKVVAAVVVLAAGGSVEVAGDAGAIAETDAGLTALPLSVTVAGALTVAAGFLRPLRRRAVAGAPELAGWALRIAVLWLLGLTGLAVLARHTFEITFDDPTGGVIGDLFGVEPRVGFRTEVPQTLVIGLLWLAGVLALALLVSRGAPLPSRLLRFQEGVRPAAHAMVVLLLATLAVGLVIGLVVAATRGHPADTFAVILLGLPNLMWLALTVGLGGAWQGRVEGPFGLPMPQVLDQVLRTGDLSTVDLGTLTGRDGRAWWLLAGAVVLVLAAGFLMAVRSPARIPPWRHALHLAVALAVTVLCVSLLARVEAHYGLSLLGIGDLGGDLGGEVSLRPRLWQNIGLGAAWGLVAGFVGGLLATRFRHQGEAPPKD
ncbi:streptophobe family protein [Streptomyces sp. NPDC005805]|uniref:streptophobe family protein n=1 Tax=Streptomyces sp. NPDC005805 TaxID=3157068 RepID=UPI0033C3129F